MEVDSGERIDFHVADLPLAAGTALLDVNEFISPTDRQLNLVVVSDESLCECVRLYFVSVRSNLLFVLDLINSTSPNIVPFRHHSEMENARSEFLNIRKAAAPSTAAQPSTFRQSQRSAGTIPCGRPYDPQVRVPLSLLSKIFGGFVKDAYDRGEPSYEALAFAGELMEVMSALYVDETERSEKIRSVFTRYGIPFEAITIAGTEYKTDLAAKLADFLYWLGEIKNEICGAKSEGYFQGIGYYVEGTRGKAATYPSSNLPCLIVLLFGEFSGFSFALRLSSCS